MKTNPDRNDCGAYRFSPSRFQFETKGLDPSWHDKTRLAMGEAMLCEGHWFLYLPFIRECLWFGEGKKAATDLRAKTLVRAYQALPKPFREKLLLEYQQFRTLWIQETELQSNTTGNDGGSAAISEALGKGLPSPYQGQEKKREDKRREDQGECEGGDGPELVLDTRSLDYGKADQLLDHLIAETGVKYPKTRAALDAAAMALQGVQQDLAGAKRAVTRQVGLLAGDIKKTAWLRPGTLFERERFANLYAELDGVGKPSQRQVLENRLKTAADPEERARLREDLRRLGEVAA